MLQLRAVVGVPLRGNRQARAVILSGAFVPCPCFCGNIDHSLKTLACGKNYRPFRAEGPYKRKNYPVEQRAVLVPKQ